MTPRRADPLSFGAVLLLLALAPRPAAAESAALLPPGGEARLPAADKQRAVAALTAALQAERVRVVSPEQAARRLARSPLRECARVECAAELGRALAVEIVAGVALWPEPGGGPATSAVVTIVDAQGAAFDATAQVAGGDLAAAVTTAYAGARERQRRGAGPWLVVDGEPAGAVVSVDGTDEGVLPFRGRVTPGSHRVRVRLAGYRPYEESVLVHDGAGTEAALRVRLPATEPEVTPPRQATKRVVPRPRTTPARHDGGGRPIVGPVVLGVAGLAALGVAGYGLLAPESCGRRGPSGACLLRENEANAAPIAVYGGAGLAAVAAAVLWFALSGPDGDGSDEPTDAPVVTLGPGGVSLAGTF